MQAASRSKAFGNIALYTVFVALALWAYAQTADFPKPLLPGYPGSGMFPRFALALMGAFGTVGIVLEVVRMARGPVDVSVVSTEDEPDSEDVATRSLSGIVIMALVMAVSVAMIEWTGMEIGVFFFIAAAIYYVTRSITWALIAGVGSVLTIYVVFAQALSVLMPLSFLPRYITW